MNPLIIDDSPIEKKLMKRHIGPFNPNKLVFASNGIEGLELIRDLSQKDQMKFDPIFTDINMPKMGGFAFRLLTDFQG